MSLSQQVRKHRNERNTLAEERQSLWVELSKMSWPPKTIEDEFERYHHADRIRAITRVLNGHAYDVERDRKPPYASTGGSYEQKRNDKADVSVKLGVHECFLDRLGRALR